jgi:hypothetical protein
MKIQRQTCVFKTFSRLSTSHEGRLAILFFRRVQMSRYKLAFIFSPAVA